MLKKLAQAIFGDPNERELKRLNALVAAVNALEPEMQAMRDTDLHQIMGQVRDRLAQVAAQTRNQLAELEHELDTEPDEEQRRVIRREIEALKSDLDAQERRVLTEELPRVYAAVREAAVRTLGQRHFDEQIMGGVVLHENRIAEMKTGEGKTLVATLPLSLNALTGRGAHLITPNDYLSKYGAQWMGPIYHLLGLSVGVIQSMGEDPSMASFLYDPDYVSADDRYMHLRPCARQQAYAADITYGTNNEFGFDYLRDNMVLDASQCVQRELHYAIVDEVDNILIDEARTPLIISGQAEESTSDYQRFAAIVRGLQPERDYAVDEKQRIATITEEGISHVESRLGIDNLYDPAHFQLTPYLENALKAKALFTRDRDYIVRDGQVIIVDEFTGRLMYGRRYSEGLHQAIEAKEGVRIQNESLTLATITFQNFFRMYRRLAGMTGTAVTEAEEFAQIYDLDVVVIPTHMPLIREDHPDVVYKNTEAKFRAVYEEIRDCHERQQPALVGTLAIETSEMMSQRLKRMGIDHEVLNAKQHEREAQIIAQAGRPGAVTIATNMAGRGVDILLGGNPEGLAREALRRKGLDLQELEPAVWEEAYAKARAECEADREVVLAAGGLHVLGTERYEARRIDNQLRGRSGRQGDPGSSRFYVSLEDDLMRRFGGPSVARIMDRLGVDEDIPIEHDMVSRAIANAQIRVEGHNFDVRKHLLEYDDVVNQQRQVIYDQRRLILSEANLKPLMLDILEGQLRGMVTAHTVGDPEDWDLRGLHQAVDAMIHLPPAHGAAVWEPMSSDEIANQVLALAHKAYAAQEERLGADMMRHIERMVMLQIIDNLWVRHLTGLDELREGIGLRAIGQRNPLVEYKREAFMAFDQLLDEIQGTIARLILNTSPRQPARQARPTRLAGASGGSAGSMRPARTHKTKVGRNDPCPCGSGLKYKQCCLKKGLSPEEAAAQAGQVAVEGRSRGR
ncbi:MAG: preprotein translocase subunit SecA [Anaerolineae bacterium]|nr:preprotein translocase subunit SecA [Anaerolineae bacterium]